MTVLDRRTAKVLFTALCFFLALAATYLARQVILIFVLAILFTHLLEPPVRFLQRHSLLFRDLRGPAVVEAYLASVTLLAVMIVGFTPRVRKAPDVLLQNVEVSLDDLGSGNLIKSLGDQFGWTEPKALQLTQFIASHREQIYGIEFSIEQTVPRILSGLVLVPILAVFFLQDGRIIGRAIVYVCAPWGNPETLLGILEEVTVVLRSYVRAQTILAAFSLLFYWVALLIFRFPHAIILGLLGAMLEFIPVAGWLITAGAIVSVGIFSRSHWIWMAVLLLLWRGVQDYVNVPRVVGKHLQIHPLLSIFGIMVGYEIGGIAGVYLSIPVIAVTGVIWRRFLPTPSQTAA